jgi:putative ABC transport system ATP-binding protein
MTAAAPSTPRIAIELGLVVKEGAAVDARILDQVSLRVAIGEIVAVHGPTAAGKTTLLNVIAGRSRPTSGVVAILGHRIDQTVYEATRQMLRARVCCVFEETDLIASLTIFDNLRLALATRVRSTPREQTRRALDALSAIGMRRRADAVLPTLSSGERQRVAIAHALVSKPPIVVVDEPGRNLDWQRTEHVVDLLVRARERAETTVILATNDIRTAARADRIVFLRNGAVTHEMRIVDSVELGGDSPPRRARY